MSERVAGILFDPDKIPWSTTWSDWVLCLCPTHGCNLWIAHDLLAAMFPGVERYSTEYHHIFTEIGGKVARLVARDPEVALEGKARAIVFTSNPIALRVGRFGGEIFVFLPRPELEQ